MALIISLLIFYADLSTNSTNFPNLPRKCTGVYNLTVCGNKDVLTRVAICQKRTNRQQNLWNSQSGTPVVFKDVQTDDSLTVDVAVIDPGTESNLRAVTLQTGRKWNAFLPNKALSSKNEQ